MREPDAAFADPRQAVLYDLFEHDRSDLDAYEAIVDELGARHVVDVGCGTGSLAVRLAARGIEVVGVDPAAASLDVARGKPHADRVRWVDGDATALLALGLTADLAVMTGNVAQVFVSDEDWARTLDAVRRSLRPGGWFVLETRRPEVRDWERWARPPTRTTLTDGRTAVTELAITDVSMPLLTFAGSATIDGEVFSSTSTLRFRSQDEVERDLATHGFVVTDVRDAPDRPGLELVVLAQASGSAARLPALVSSAIGAEP